MDSGYTIQLHGCFAHLYGQMLLRNSVCEALSGTEPSRSAFSTSPDRHHACYWASSSTYIRPSCSLAVPSRPAEGQESASARGSLRLITHLFSLPLQHRV